MKPLLLLALALGAAPAAAERHPAGAAPSSLTAAQLAIANSGRGIEIPLSNQTLACLILSDKDCMENADAARSIMVDARHVPMAPRVFTPAISALFDAYPTGSVPEIKTRLGRQNEAWIQNTCVIRVSWAMNHAEGSPFVLPRAMLGPQQKLNFITNATDPARTFAYMYRVDEFANYMLKKYGKPQVFAVKAEGGGSPGEGAAGLRRAVAGKPGVILFVVRGWNDATGHFDLWDGSQVKGHEYFDKASHVFLWQ